MSAASAPEPETSTGPDVVIGVDTHKHTHMAVALRTLTRRFQQLDQELKVSGGYEPRKRRRAPLDSSPVPISSSASPVAVR